jgi:hypothetical protein
MPMGCLTLLLLAVVVWVAVQFVLIPSLEKDANRQGHKLKDYTNRLLHGR